MDWTDGRDEMTMMMMMGYHRFFSFAAIQGDGVSWAYDAVLFKILFLSRLDSCMYAENIISGAYSYEMTMRDPFPFFIYVVVTAMQPQLNNTVARLDPRSCIICDVNVVYLHEGSNRNRPLTGQFKKPSYTYFFVSFADPASHRKNTCVKGREKDTLGLP